MRNSLVVSISALSLASLQCGGGESPGAGVTSGYDPCALITEADAEAAVSVDLVNEVHDTTAQNATGQKLCFYADPNDTLKMVQLGINEQASMGGGLTAERLYADMRDLLDSEVPVSDVGDEAFWGGRGLQAGSGLWVLMRDKGVILSVLVGDPALSDAAVLAAEKALAATATGRL